MSILGPFQERTRQQAADSGPIPGTMRTEESLGEQLPFPNDVVWGSQEEETARIAFPDMPTTGDVAASGEENTVSGQENVPARPMIQHNSTGIIMARPTGMLPQIGAEANNQATTNLRTSTLIYGNRKRAAASAEVSPGVRRNLRILAHSITLFGMFLMILSVLMGVLPANGGNSTLAAGITGSSNVSNMDQAHGDGLGIQQSTPTPTPSPTPDLYYTDPNSGGGAAVNGPSLPVGTSRFSYGQCTAWADMRYNDLTGWRVPWNGNANVWDDNAPAYGWIVSSTPHIPSIVVIEPGVQGAGGVGHVAIAESINGDGSVYTSNWNWSPPGATISYVNFTPGYGIHFVYHP